MPELVPIAISFAVSLALSLVTQLVSSLLSPKPKTPDQGFDSRTDTALGVTDPRDIVFGQTHKGGTIVFKKVSTDTHRMWLVIALAGHECQSVDFIWLGNVPMLIRTDGTVSNLTSSPAVDYTSNLSCWIHLGTDTQTYDTNLAAEFPLDWTSTSTLFGVCYAVVELTYSATLFAQGVPNISFSMRGYNHVYDPRTGATGYSDNPLLCTAAYLVDTRLGLASSVATTIDDIETTVLSAEANVCDEFVSLPRFEEHFTMAYGDTQPLSGSGSVSAATDIITFTSAPNPLFRTGDLVWTPSAVLTPNIANTVVYVIRLSNTTMKVATTYANALAGTAIDFTVGTATSISFRFSLPYFKLWGKQTTFTANASTNIITFADDVYGSRTGTYNFLAVFQSTTTLPAPLVAGTIYRLYGAAAALQFTVHDSNDALIDITSTGSGTHTVQLISKFIDTTFLATVVDIVNDLISFGSGNYDLLAPVYTGMPVQFGITGGGSTGFPSPLVGGVTYFLIPCQDTFGGQAFRVAETLGDALTNNYIDLTSIGSALAGLLVFALDINQDEVLGMTTGTKVQLYVTDGAGDPLPTPFVAGTDYYLIATGHGYFQLAATLADALANNPLFPTDNTMGFSTTPTTWGIRMYSERRYVANGVTSTDATFEDAIKSIMSAAAGDFIPPGDMWRLYAGQWRVPLTTLGLDSIRPGGAPKVQLRLTNREAINTVTGTYNSPVNFDEAGNFPTSQDPDAVVEDANQVLATDIQLDFTSSKWTAMRIAAILRRQARYQRTIQWQTDLSLFDFTVPETCQVSIPGMGLDDFYFVAQSTQLGVDTQSSDAQGPIPTLDITLRETHPSIYYNVVSL